MSHLVSLDWNPDCLGCIEAEIAGGAVRVLRALQWEWPKAIDPEQEPTALGDWIRQQLHEAGVSGRTTIVVLPREEVVTRRLELPHAPDDELPELVRFQAAAKSATPLDQLTLDFVPLPPIEGEQARPALMATLDRKRVDHLQKVCSSAGLELKSIQTSPFAVAEVAIRREQQRGDDPNLATLVIFQDERRVELSILQNLGLVFTHHTRVDPGNPRAVRGTMAEISRSIITFGQLMHSTVDVGRVCLIHDGAVDPALEQALSERFSGQLHVIDPANDQSLLPMENSLSVRLAGLAPAMGAVLGELKRTVPSVDFVNPRKPPVPRDLRKEQLIYYGIRAGAAALLIGLLAWWYASHLGSQIAVLEKRDGELGNTLSQAGPTRDAHGRIQAWVASEVHPLEEIDRLNKLLPGTDRLLLLDLQVLPGRQGELARVTGSGIARTERDITNLFDTLTAAGYKLQPQVSDFYKLDPDYPHKFTLDASRLPAPQRTSRSTPAT
ncbi:MAG: type IV pilus biogenesis protein PilM [Planctomycetaceae bacterium]